MDALPAVADPVIASGTSVRHGPLLRRLGLVLAVAAVAEVIGIAIVSGQGNPAFPMGADLASIGFIASVLLFPSVAALILWQRPSNRVAWLMVAIGLATGLGIVGFGYGSMGLAPGSNLPLASYALVLSQVLFVPVAGAGIASLLLIYPTDRLPGRGWRVVLAAALLGAAIYGLATLVDPSAGARSGFPTFRNPLGAPTAWSSAVDNLITLGNSVVTGSIVAGAVSLAVRYQRSDPVVAAQIRWLALVGSVAAVAFVVAALQAGPVSDVAFGIGLVVLATMPVAIGIAISRYHLFDIDRLINRALVYGSLTAILAGVFTAAVGLAQRLFVVLTGESSDAAVVATTLVVATLYAPVRKRLEAIVDRRFKYEELRFGEHRNRLEELLAMLEPGRAAASLVQMAVDELTAIGGGVLDASGQPVVIAGAWPVPATVRLAFPGDVGLEALVLGPRRDGRSHDPRAIRDLEELLALASAALRVGAGQGRRAT